MCKNSTSKLMQYISYKQIKKMTHIILIFLFFISITTKLYPSQNYNNYIGKISYYTKLMMKQNHIVGLSVEVVKKNDIIWSNGFGYSNLRKKIKATNSTIYRVASITKVFTALGIMILQDHNLLNINNSVEKYLPEFSIQPDDDNDTEKDITIKELLTHTAGLPVSLGYIPYNEQLKILKNKHILFKPGTRFLYSNLGYNILGKVIENITKMKYTVFEQKRILNPLEMKDSFFWINYEQKPVATGYYFKNNKYIPVDHVGYICDISSASLCSSVKDIGNFLKFIFNHGTFNNRKILKYKLIKEMIKSQGFSRGLGFTIYHFRTPSKLVVGHSGSSYGYTGFFIAAPYEKTGVVILTNTDNVVVPVERLGRIIFNLFLDIKE